jgi:hypothetical protein
MRMSMVSALCVVFASAGLSHPAAAQVNAAINPGDLQSIQIESPTTAQSDPQPPTKLPHLQSLQTWSRLLTRPTGARPGWQQFGKAPEDQPCAWCAHIQIYEAPPNLDPKIIIEEIPPISLRPLQQPLPLSPNMLIYHGFPPCPNDVHPFPFRP